MAQTTLPPADLLPVRREATLSYRLVRLVGVPLLHLVFRFDVTGKENIPRSGNYLVIANHLNWLDEFAILLLFPVEPRIHFLADPTLLVTRRSSGSSCATPAASSPLSASAMATRPCSGMSTGRWRWEGRWRSSQRETTGPLRAS